MIIKNKIKNKKFGKKNLDTVQTALSHKSMDEPYTVMSIEMEMGCYIEKKVNTNIIHFILFVQREENFKFSVLLNDDELLLIARDLQKQRH